MYHNRVQCNVRPFAFLTLSTTCFPCVQTKVLNRCQSVELKPVLQELCSLFFDPVYKTNVSVEAFTAVCEKYIAAPPG